MFKLSFSVTDISRKFLFFPTFLIIHGNIHSEEFGLTTVLGKIIFGKAQVLSESCTFTQWAQTWTLKARLNPTLSAFQAKR